MPKSLRPSRSLILTGHRRAFILFASLLGCFALATPSSVSSLIAGLRSLATGPDNGSAVRPMAATQRGQRPRSTSCNTCPPPSPRRIYAPAIDLDEAQKCEIVLNSRSAHPIDITPTFYTANGNAVVGNSVQLQPAEIKFVPVEQLMPESLRGRHRWGGIALSYTGNVLEVWAQITFHGIGGSSIDETFNILEESGSDTREAVWLMPRQSVAIIALGNSSSTSIHTTAQFAGEASEEFEIPAGVTRMIRHHSRGRDDGIASESVKLTTTGPDGALRVAGFIIGDDDSFASSIRFYDTKKIVQPNLYAIDLRLKNTRPRIVLENTSANEISAQPRFLSAAAGEQGSPVELPSMTLRPQQILDVDLSALRQAAASRTDLDSVNVQILSTAAPGSLIGAAYSTDRASGLTYDVPLRDSGKVRNATGSYPWRVDNDYSTTVVLTNVGAQPTRFQVEIRYPGGPYSIKQRELAVGETARFDLRKIRDEQQPDRTGKTLPAALDRGQFHWSIVATPGEARIIGRAEVVSRSGRVASSYSCPVCCPDNGPTAHFNPNSYPLYVDGVAFVGANGDYWDCYFNYYTGSASWNSLWTTNTSVATVNGGTSELQGVNAGDTDVVGEYQYVYWENDGMDCYQRFDSASDSAPVDVLGITWTTPHGLNGLDGIVPLKNGTPPQGSPAFINSTTITATGSPSGGTYSWSTSSNKVTLTDTSSATVTVTAAAESDSTRDVTITVTYTQNGHSTSRQILFTVQKPTFMAYVSTDASGAATCDSGQSGKKKDITWQLQDKNHNPITYALPTYDTVTNNTPNSCFNPATGEGTPPGNTTGSGGQWSHHYALCSTACQNAGSCSLTGTQKYFSNGYEIDQSFTMSCSAITVDGH